jgi:hypothetical protein
MASRYLQSIFLRWWIDGADSIHAQLAPSIISARRGQRTPLQSNEMRASVTVVVVLVGFMAVLDAQTSSPSCSSAAECTQQAEAAIANQAFEQAHDLAWRAMQVSRNDAAAMLLLARTQSLSGRPHDALVMLRRLAAMKVRPADVATSDDFRRVRALPGWDELFATLTGATIDPAPTEAVPPNASVPAKIPSATRDDKPAPRDVTSAAAPAGAGTGGLAVPAPIATPVALAYDAVSRRFVLADDGSDTLKVVDELTGNVVNLVSRGWANGYRPVALAIDTRRGDLWAAGVEEGGPDGGPHSALLKLQLVSGRLLQTIPLPHAGNPVRIVDVGVGRNLIWALDASGRRLFVLSSNGSPQAHALDIAGAPTSLAVAGDGTLYVAHADGIARVNPATFKATALVTAAKVDARGLQSLAWHNGRLFGIQRLDDGSHAAVRIRLDGRGGRIIAVERLESAAARASAIYGGKLYFVGRDGEQLMFRNAAAR